MNEEIRNRIRESLTALEEGASALQLERIASIREELDRIDESEGEEISWEERYKELLKEKEEIDNKYRELDEAYRRRWDETTTGTKVNGTYVDKTVDRVDTYTYNSLLGL